MRKILVSLIGGQTIPNIRFIKEHKKDVDSYLFISTEEMEKEGKVEMHLATLNISFTKIQRIIVEKFSFSKIEDTLLNASLNDENEYIVNITGGTKPMSIVALSFFSIFSNVKIFYVPIGEEKYRQVYPRIEEPEQEFKEKISLKEYLSCHNLQLLKKEVKISRNLNNAQILLDQLINADGEVNIDEITRAHSMKNTDDRVYYSGGWFEELIYSKIKRKFQLSENQIAYNVKLKNRKSNNEYDAIFVHKDSIYILECKAYIGTSGLHKKVEGDLYKLGALDDDFGLKVKAIYITTADIGKNNIKESKSLRERAKSLKIQMFQLSDLKNDKFLNLIN